MKTSTPNSPFFLPEHWLNSSNALALANTPSTPHARMNAEAAKLGPKGRAALAEAKAKAKAQGKVAVVTDAQIEEQKVVNREPFSGESDATKRAKLMGLTVKALRAKARDAGLKRYSKAKKAVLVSMLTA